MKKPFVLFILGPTASGKSEFAMRAAKKFGGEIINCDSVQVYKELNIGSAKPTYEERRIVPHHLVDFVNPGEKYNAADFRRDALKIIEERSSAGQRMFYVVGGSGFYIQALLKGMYDIPAVPIEIKQQCDKESLESLYEEVKVNDPEYCLKLKNNDRYRIQRAVEVIRSTGKNITYFENNFEDKPFPYPHRVLGINTLKPLLRERVELRTRKMILHGILAETKNLLDQGYEGWAPLSSVGYRECVKHLKGEIYFEDLQKEIVQSTMQLIKKQNTWFKKENSTIWFDTEHGSVPLMNFIGEIVAYVNPALPYEMKSSTGVAEL